MPPVRWRIERSWSFDGMPTAQPAPPPGSNATPYKTGAPAGKDPDRIDPLPATVFEQCGSRYAVHGIPISPDSPAMIRGVHADGA